MLADWVKETDPLEVVAFDVLGVLQVGGFFFASCDLIVCAKVNSRMLQIAVETEVTGSIEGESGIDLGCFGLW